MIGEYKPHAWFWEFVKMYMKLLIMCCLTFYEYDIPNKVQFTFLFYLILFSKSGYVFIDPLHLLLGCILRFLAVLLQTLQNQTLQ